MKYLTKQEIKDALNRGIDLTDKTVSNKYKEIWVEGAMWMQDYLKSQLNPKDLNDIS